MRADAPSYRGYRFPPEIISHAVWLYHRLFGRIGAHLGDNVTEHLDLIAANQGGSGPQPPVDALA